jgi:hypothetical protein
MQDVNPHPTRFDARPVDDRVLFGREREFALLGGFLDDIGTKSHPRGVAGLISEAASS